MLFSAATWLTMVRVERASLGVGAGELGASFASILSAESWIGVRDCVSRMGSRRATSAQAAARCACARVMSSNTTTRPPARRRQAARASQEKLLLAAAMADARAAFPVARALVVNDCSSRLCELRQPGSASPQRASSQSERREIHTQHARRRCDWPR
jgi:hypothetical protein